MTKFKRQLLPLLIALICALGIALFAACGGKVEAESVTLNETELTLEVDDAETLTATVAPENAEDKTVTWTSSDPAIASVDENGNVTGVSAGTATVTATTANGKTATCEVTVEPKTYQRMTKAEWEAAFDATLAARNFTVSRNSYSTPSNVTSADDFKESIDQIKLDDVNGRIYNSGKHEYFVVEDGTVYWIDERDGSKEDFSEEFEDKEALFDYFAVGLYQEELRGDVLRGLYDAIISFDETANAYVVSLEGVDLDTDSTEMTLTFADGKFSRIEITQTVNNFELVSWMAYSDYGTTVVESPAFDDGESVTPAASNEVTEEQWTQILGNVTKFTVNMSVNDTDIATIKIDGDKRSMYNGQEEQIYVRDGDSYSQYAYDGSAWTKSDLQESDYTQYTELYAQLLKLFEDSYSLFTYNDGKYSATSVETSSTMIGTAQNVEATFEDGVLTAFVCYAEVQNVTYCFEISDIGTTVVEVPTDYTEDFATLWERTLSGVKNYTVAVYNKNNVQVSTVKVDIETSENWKIAVGNTYYTCESGQYFSYRSSSGNWVKNNLDAQMAKSLYSNYRWLVYYLSDDFDSFTYSETDQIYTCSSLKLGSKTATDLVVQFVDNALVYFAYVDEDGFLYEVGQFGTTTVELPQVDE